MFPFPLKKFFCCGLPKGGLAIAIISIVASAIIMLIGFYGLYITMHPPPSDYDYDDDYDRTPTTGDYLWDGLMILVPLVHLITSIILLVGVIKERPLWFIPWMVTCIIIIIFCIWDQYWTIKAVLELVSLIHIFQCIRVLLMIALNVYMWLAIFFLYKEMKNKST